MISASRYIAENFKNNISLNDVAEFLNLNPAYFSSKFKAFHGIGFSEYLRNTRINHAEWYLIETDLSMSDVADECGFCSSNYFGDTFKIVNGISPSEFSHPTIILLDDREVFFNPYTASSIFSPFLLTICPS